MVRRILPLIVAVAAFACSAAAFGDGNFADGNKVEPAGAFADPGASEAVRKVLDAKGYRVSAGDGSVICEIWFRNGVVAGKTEAPGAVYTSLGESALVGVVSFPKGARDYRGQAVKPGAYTLRYALHPADGNHLGISPIRDFLMLVPVAVDQNPDASYKFEELAKMSAKTSGTNHPGIWSLASPENKGAAALSTNEHGHLVLSATIKSSTGAEMPIAVIVKGIAEQ